MIGDKKEEDVLSNILNLEKYESSSFNIKNETIVFVSYIREDYEAAKRLCQGLKNANLNLKPWIDTEILADQRWDKEIKKAIQKSRYFIPLISLRVVEKKGGYTRDKFEYALDVIKEIQQRQKIIILPVRLNDCKIPYSQLEKIGYVDLFPDWKAGFEKILEAIKQGDNLVGGRHQFEEEETKFGTIRNLSKKILYPLNSPEINIESKYQSQIERYPCAQFPSKVVLKDIIPLEVIIKSTQPAYYDKHLTSITLIAENIKQRQIPVLVILESGGFEIIGNKYYDTINVPVKAEDSKPIIFNLKAKKEGLQTIEIRFYQQETYVGKIKIDALVVPPDKTIKMKLKKLMVGTSKQKALQTTKEWKSPDKLPDKVVQAPDITMIIYEKRIVPDLEYDILITALGIPLQKIGSINFPFNPETKFHKIFEDIENINLPANIVDKKIKAKGISLYDELFPPSLKKLYWEKRDGIKSIRVISKEPWIPWEIVKPWHESDDGNIEEDEFLCERYAFSRWIVDKPETIKEELKKVKVIVPSDTKLVSALEERDWIQDFGDSKGLDVSFDSTYEQVLTTLETGGIDLLHFSTHGEHNKDSPLLSAIELEDRVPLRPEDISGRARQFGKSSPFVILNACQTSNQGFYLTGVQGWATKFLDAGASLFIGTLWSVSDEIAFRFVQELYNQFSSGTALGESVRQARNNCKQSGDPSWLAYQLYGHPNSTINIGPK